MTIRENEDERGLSLKHWRKQLFPASADRNAKSEKKTPAPGPASEAG
jgi:hypothetical protein